MEAPRLKDHLIVYLSFSLLTTFAWPVQANKNKHQKNETTYAKAAAKNASDTSVVRTVWVYDSDLPTGKSGGLLSHSIHQ